MKVKEKSEKGGLKLNIQKTKIMACGPISSVQFSHSVVSDSANPWNCSMRGFPLLHHLPEFAQTHFHGISDAIQPSHLLLSPSSPDLNLSEHQSLFQHHNLRASILGLSAFFRVQFSHLYTTTGKTIALTRWIFVGKVMSLLLKMLSRLVIAFLPRSKRLLISWLQSPSAVILEPPKIKSVTASSVSPSIRHEVMSPS